MILSIVIVNFNVKYFLEQCLCSIEKAVGQSILLAGNTEVFVVDNASTDGSVDFLEPLYPQFHFIRNRENSGFAKGNNLALAHCSGEYILFLNPDTILAEDSLDLCISFLQANSGAGGVGVRMIDGRGAFLRESKRGFPGPRASFFKMSGLASLFPRSRVLAAYYAGDLDPRHNHPVDILSGACMMVPKEVLDKTGGFDGQFFMYAEDIDLSYRIRKAGFQNYYLASTSIIHFKGESTPRDAGRLKQFYFAMNQFLKKHFLDSSPSRMLFFLNRAVALKLRMEMIRLRFQKTPGDPARIDSVFIKGEPDNPDLLRNAFREAGIRLAETEAAAGGILFCESAGRSMKSIIREMDEAPRRLSFYIHGSGTHAAVGSSSQEEKGDVISW
ncbi:MAG TPA: glycosyltransferase family 2 protein [Puia sp.]